MRRALLSVSDKSGVVDFARGLAQRGFELVSTGGTARVLQEAGLAVTPISRGHEVSGDDGRARQDAPSSRARRDSGAPQSSRGSGICGGTRHHADRSRRRQSVPVRPRGRESRYAVRRIGRGDRHRRSKSRARGGQKFRGRARGRVASRLCRWSSNSSIASDGPDSRISIRAGPQGIHAHGAVRHRHCGHSLDGHERARRLQPRRGGGAARCAPVRPPEGS